MPLPSSATEIRNGAWVLSGNSILKDGRSIQVHLLLKDNKTTQVFFIANKILDFEKFRLKVRIERG
jgi:hypothetical protein